MRPLVLGFQFPSIGLGTYVSSHKTVQRWRICVSFLPKFWAVGLLSSGASLLNDTAEREATQLFLFCNSKSASLLTGALCTYSQAQKGIETFLSHL